MKKIGERDFVNFLLCNSILEILENQGVEVLSKCQGYW